MLRWLKTVVVSDVEKAHEMRQVGIEKTVRDTRCGDRAPVDAARGAAQALSANQFGAIVPEVLVQQSA